METPLEQIRKERKEFEQVKKNTMQEIQIASIKLDAQLKFFDGHRDIKSWEASLQHPIDKLDFERQRNFFDAQIAFKREQLNDKFIVEKNEGYKDGLRQKFELAADIDMLEIQKKIIDTKEKISDKGEEIRTKLKEHDAELMKKHLPEVKK